MDLTDSDDHENEGELLLSVIIVNYNGLSFLGACLKALTRNVSCPYEIIIVDNNSSDDSRKYITKNWPDVRLICSPDNLGFAKGNNLGAECARGKFLLLLNNDTEILQSLQPLFDYFEDHPDTAIVGSRLRNPDGSVQPSVGHDHSPLRLLLPGCCYAIALGSKIGRSTKGDQHFINLRTMRFIGFLGPFSVFEDVCGRTFQVLTGISSCTSRMRISVTVHGRAAKKLPIWPVLISAILRVGDRRG